MEVLGTTLSDTQCKEIEEQVISFYSSNSLGLKPDDIILPSLDEDLIVWVSGHVPVTNPLSVNVRTQNLKLHERGYLISTALSVLEELGKTKFKTVSGLDYGKYASFVWSGESVCK